MDPVRSLLGGVIGGAGSMAFGSYASPWFRAIQYASNMSQPNLVIPPMEILSGLHRGRLDVGSAYFAFLAHGCDPTVNWTSTPWVSVWADKRYAHVNSLGPTANATQAMIWSNQWYPSPDLTLQLLNRGLIGQQEAFTFLRAMGTTDSNLCNAIKELSNVIPPVTDIVRFAVKEAFLTGQIGRQFWDEADAEIPDAYTFWADKVGLRQTTVNNGAGTESIDFAKLYWRTHYNLPAAGQGYSFLQRLRPDGGIGNGPRDPSGQVFTQANLQQLLRYLDYHPLYRKQLEAISYRVIGRVDLRRLRLFDIIPAAESKEYFKDAGYNDRDASRLATMNERIVQRQRYGSITRTSRAQIKEAYCLGAIDDIDASRLLQMHGLTLEEVKITLDVYNIECRVDRLKRMVKLVARKVYAGIWSINDGANALRRIGIVEESISQSTDVWELELSGPRRTIQANKIQELVTRGLLTLPDARIRLQNLGYSITDTDLILLAASQDYNKSQTRALVQALRSQKQAANELARQAKEQKALHRQTIAELARHSSPEKLRRWLIKDIITPDLAMARLRSLDWPIDDATRLVDEALLDRNAKLERLKNATQPPKQNGTGTSQ